MCVCACACVYVRVCVYVCVRACVSKQKKILLRSSTRSHMDPKELSKKPSSTSTTTRIIEKIKNLKIKKWTKKFWRNEDQVETFQKNDWKWKDFSFDAPGYYFSDVFFYFCQHMCRCKNMCTFMFKVLMFFPILGKKQG